ncbi:hypothetical protein HDU85_003463 [Gaertneriomyces sp. JEL0708]|nr:hypothetical protein BC832DRAFT_592127 [Gaertneriomyces semiglobifer]KAJ3181945.1 hypothetical protein HDU85_003463 [Gaertneriomyces sp. JEL0708]
MPSIFPPSISGLGQLGKLTSSYPQAHPTLFNRMKVFYKNIPKGQAQPFTPKTIWQRYHARYIATSSPKPLLHFLGVMVPTGYYISYFKGGHYHPRFEFH